MERVIMPLWSWPLLVLGVAVVLMLVIGVAVVLNLAADLIVRVFGRDKGEDR